MSADSRYSNNGYQAIIASHEDRLSRMHEEVQSVGRDVAVMQSQIDSDHKQISDKLDLVLAVVEGSREGITKISDRQTAVIGRVDKLEKDTISKSWMQKTIFAGLLTVGGFLAQGLWEFAKYKWFSK